MVMSEMTAAVHPAFFDCIPQRIGVVGHITGFCVKTSGVDGDIRQIWLLFCNK